MYLKVRLQGKTIYVPIAHTYIEDKSEGEDVRVAFAMLGTGDEHILTGDDAKDVLDQLQYLVVPKPRA